MAIVLAAILNTGCRSALSPDIDRNRPPETWISAAPQDSITIRNRDGTITRPRIGTIPYRFHMYWAGSDRDGAVTGFYWAVVETLPLPPDGVGQIPPLPGPRASQYRYTTRTDSVFSFNVSEFSPDRQHAFYIYAVDDKGKADPTPARFIFNALDRFPPLVLFDLCDPRPANQRPGKKGCDDGGYGGSATGKIARVLSPGTVTLFDTTVYITDSLDLRNPSLAPRDTIPSTARIDFAWRSEATVVGGEAQRYKYKLDEPLFNEVDASVRAVSYNAGVGTLAIRPGPKQFTLRALDAAGGAREVTRKFQMNWAPDTWFAGPDPATFPLQPGGERWETPNFNALSYPGTLLSCDSLTKWPSERPPRKTFWEVWKDRIYIRSDEDTVHMNAWLVVPTGGRDDDSPYAVRVDRNDPVLDTVVCAPGGEARVIRPGDLKGQPIGFRLGYAHKLDPGYFSINTPTQQSLYPVFDAASSFRKPEINGYIVFRQSGRVYLMARSQDGDGTTDNSLGELVAASELADRVDRGGGTPEEVKLRTKILTFYVNKSPYFLFGDTGFFPKPPEYNGGVVVVSASRRLDLNLLAADDDPFDFGQRPEPGGPSPNTTLRFHVTVHGRDAAGRDTFYVAPRVFVPNQTIDLDVDAPFIRNTDLTLTIELCDCATCETQTGTGRCIYVDIPVIVPAPTAALGSEGSGSTLARRPPSSRPGSRYEP